MSEINIASISPKAWEGELTKDFLRMIVAGLAIPSYEMSVRLAKELLKIQGKEVFEP